MKIDRRTLRRMENLKGLCDFDTKTGMATVRIRYSCAEDIVDTNFGSPESPVIKAEAIDYLEQILDIVPQEFSVKVSMSIEDYQGYDPQILVDSYDTAAETLDYTEKSGKKKKSILMLFFILIGLFFLVISIVAKKNNWFGFGGNGFSMIAVILIEALFEIYYEESFIFFAVTSRYNKLLNKNYGRFKGIFLAG